MTPKQIELARHALGFQEGKKLKVSYRNRFVTDADSDDGKEWMQMVRAGHAARVTGIESLGGMDFFYLKRSGALSVLKKGETLCREDFPVMTLA